jgi:hypothetical protein
MDEDDVIPGSVIPGGEVRDDFENFGNTVKILEYIAAGFDPYGPSGTANQEFRTVRAYLQQIYGPLPEGAVDYASGDLNKDGVNEVYAVDANGNPHTVYGYDDNNEVESTVYTDYLRDTIYGGIAPQTWEDVERILRAEGYSDSEIASAENSLVKTGNYSEWLEFPENRGKEFGGIKYCHEVEQTFGNPMGDDCQTRGSINLGYILGRFGYGDGEWWDTRPTAGTECTTSEGTAGITNPDGTCKEDTTQLPGASCANGPHGSTGVLDDDGNCTFVEGNSCDPPENPSGYGKINAEGNCVEIGQGTSGGDCTIVTQENADECGYEITSDGQLIPKNLDDPDLPTYTSCGGGIWADQNTDCPDIDGVSDFCNDPANASHPDCRPQTVEELIEEYGEAVVGTAQKVYEQVKGAIQDATDDPLGTLHDIITGGYMSGNEKCYNSKGSYDRSTGTYRTHGHTDCTTAGNPEETGDVCWKDCVNASIFGGIPGLPGLPGNIDAGTYRDLENVIKEAGGTIQDILSAPTGNPNDPGFIEEVKEWVIGKIDDIFGGVEDVTVEKITGWISTILDASVASIILTQTADATNTVTTKIEDIVFGVGPDTDDSINCAEYGRQGDTGTLGDGGEVTGCGPCLSTHQEVDGKCVEWEDNGDTEEECTEKNREYIPSTAAGTASSCGKCKEEFDPDVNNPEGPCIPSLDNCQARGLQKNDLTGECEEPLDCTPKTPCTTKNGDPGKYGDDCECIPDFVNDGPTPEQCEARGRYHVAAVPEQSKPSDCGDCTNGSTNEDCSIDENCETIDATNADKCGYKECNGAYIPKEQVCPTIEDPECETIDATNADKCGYKECNGAYIPKEQVCSPTVNPCINGEEPDPQKGCPEDWCDEAMTIAPDENGQCPSDPPLVECPDGSMVTSLDECDTTPPLVECPDGSMVTSLDECDTTPPLVECPDGSMVTSLDECGTTTYTCPDPNATTNEDGSCGPCKTGYVYDGAVERCVQSTTPDPCLDAAYAEANQDICGTGDDCDDCTCAEYAAANPEECATGPDTPSGGGGGGGGGGSTGGSGMFDLESFEIAGDPQLLARTEFPIENFLQQYIDGPDNQDISITGLFEGFV